MNGPVAHPFDVDETGRVARADPDEHVGDLVRQLLLTSPGERVNRPDFGCGLLEMVFEPNTPALAAATSFLVRTSMEHWLSDLAVVHDVTIEPREERLLVEVVYSRPHESRRRRERVEVPGLGGGPP